MIIFPTNAVPSPYAAAKWFAKTTQNMQSQSLAEYTEETTLAPVILLDNTLAVYAEDRLEDLLQTLLSIYTAQYLVAVSYETYINGVKVMDILKKFSTQTSMTNSPLGYAGSKFGLLDADDDADYLPFFGLEAYPYDPEARAIEKELREARKYTREVNNGFDVNADRRAENQDRRQDTAFNNKNYYDFRDDGRKASAEERAAKYFEDDEVRKKAAEERAGQREGREAEKLQLDRNKDQRDDEQSKLSGLKSSYDNNNTIHTITDASNLTVGKLIDVKLVNKGVTVTVPVRAVLSPKYITPEAFLQMSGTPLDNTSSWARWHLWRSGAIGFADYLFCMDLIAANKKRMLADTTGTLATSVTKKLKLIATAILSGNAAPNSVSTGIVISKQTATLLENQLGGPLTNPHIRQEYFASNNTCMLVVVDTRRETFVLYQKGIADYKIYGFSTISKNRSKPNGVDINSVLDAYKLGNAATL